MRTQTLEGFHVCPVSTALSSSWLKPTVSSRLAQVALLVKRRNYFWSKVKRICYHCIHRIHRLRGDREEVPLNSESPNYPVTTFIYVTLNMTLVELPLKPSCNSSAAWQYCYKHYQSTIYLSFTDAPPWDKQDADRVVAVSAED